MTIQRLVFQSIYYIQSTVVSTDWFLIFYCRLLANGFFFKEKEQDILMRRILTEQITLYA